MKTLFAAAAAAVFAFATPALAQSPLGGADVYGTLGYTHMTADTEEVDIGLGAATARVGARFARFIGVEVEGSIGAFSDEIDVSLPVKIEMQHQIAAYVVGFAPVRENIDLFARVGLGTANYEISAEGESVDGDSETVNFGVGGQFWFDANNAARLEYTRWEGDEDADEDDDFSGFDSNTISLSYVRRF
jgi:hypothetical protein